LIDEVQNLDKAFEKLENRLGRAWCHQMVAELYRLEGNYDEAKTKCNEAARLCGKNVIDYEVCLAYISLNEAEILRAQGRYDAAIEKYRQVLGTEIGTLRRHQAHAALGIAETNRMKGARRKEEYEKPLETYDTIGMRHGMVHTLIGLALMTAVMEKENLTAVLFQAREYCLARPRLRKELALIKQIERNALTSGKDIPNWLHPLEFP
jgi:tetratricopeptide (TPR) repeat protein